MHWTIQLLISIAVLGIGLGMMCMEHIRNRTGRPFLKSEAVAIPYWLAYLSFTVLGAALTLSAIIR